jgi:hypothetical protein
MTAARSSRGVVLTSLCLVICGAFASVIYLEIDQQAEKSPEIAAPGSPAPAKPSVAPQDAAPEAMSFTMPARAAYIEVLERPPFSETRRPAPPLAAAGAARDQPLAASVIGTILSADGARALIAHGEPARLGRFAEGQDIEGWTVKSIVQDKVVLTRGGATIELKVKGGATEATTPDAAFRQPPRPRITKSPNAAPPVGAPNNAKAPTAKTSVAARSPDPDGTTPVNEAAPSQPPGRVSPAGGAQATSRLSGSRRAN